jgi:hypothetical protein
LERRASLPRRAARAPAADLSVIAATIASVAVLSSGSFLLIGDTIHLEAIVRDARGRVVMEPAVSWSVDPGSVATVANGVVTAREKGAST